MRITVMSKPTAVERRWYVVDAAGVPLGRLASKVAHILRGKHRPTYTPHIDNGDHVIVINADRVALTGRKLDNKMYYRHSGYPGGLKAMTYRELLRRNPERAVRKAVWGMLPKHRLGRRLIGKLRVYAGPEHPHQAQQPEPLRIR